MFPWENLDFLNVRDAGFWHSGRPFALLKMPSLQNLKDFLVTPPLNPLLGTFDTPFLNGTLSNNKCNRN